MNTLADFRISKTYRGQNGEGGSGNDCTGHGGDDIQVPVPVGTVVTDVETGETLGDLTTSGQTLLWPRRERWVGEHAVQVEHQPDTPQGGSRSARGEARTRPGIEIDCGRGAARAAQCGEVHADSRRLVGQAKVADYPFTTLYPNLGVVTVGLGRSFVMADIPGLIEGRPTGPASGSDFEASAADADPAAPRRHRAAGSGR